MIILSKSTVQSTTTSAVSSGNYVNLIFIHDTGVLNMAVVSLFRYWSGTEAWTILSKYLAPRLEPPWASCFKMVHNSCGGAQFLWGCSIPVGWRTGLVHSRILNFSHLHFTHTLHIKFYNKNECSPVLSFMATILEFSWINILRNDLFTYWSFYDMYLLANMISFEDQPWVLMPRSN